MENQLKNRNPREILNSWEAQALATLTSKNFPTSFKAISEIMNNDAETDTLKLESVKTLPNEKDSSLLPESMNTEEDTSGVAP